MIDYCHLTILSLSTCACPEYYSSTKRNAPGGSAGKYSTNSDDHAWLVLSRTECPFRPVTAFGSDPSCLLIPPRSSTVEKIKALGFLDPFMTSARDFLVRESFSD